MNQNYETLQNKMINEKETQLFFFYDREVNPLDQVYDVSSLKVK